MGFFKTQKLEGLILNYAQNISSVRSIKNFQKSQLWYMDVKFAKALHIFKDNGHFPQVKNPLLACFKCM